MYDRKCSVICLQSRFCLFCHNLPCIGESVDFMEKFQWVRLGSCRRSPVRSSNRKPIRSNARPCLSAATARIAGRFPIRRRQGSAGRRTPQRGFLRFPASSRAEDRDASRHDSGTWRGTRSRQPTSASALALGIQRRTRARIQLSEFHSSATLASPRMRSAIQRCDFSAPIPSITDTSARSARP